MYSQKFKEKVLRRYYETRKMIAMCREFHIGRETLQRWRKGRQQFDEEMRVKLCVEKEMEVHQEEMDKLQTEYEILQFAYDYLQPTLKEKLEIADQLKGKYKTKVMCRVIRVNHSTFYMSLKHLKEKLTHFEM